MYRQKKKKKLTKSEIFEKVNLSQVETTAQHDHNSTDIAPLDYHLLAFLLIYFNEDICSLS